jgi:hypothetical protein
VSVTCAGARRKLQLRNHRKAYKHFQPHSKEKLL